MGSDSSLKVFYDGSCPICKREISVYQRMKTRSEIKWVDASSMNFDEQRYGLSRVDALSKFHIKTADGQILAGIPAFQQLWSQLPMSTLSAVAEYRWVRKLMALAYRTFCRLRGPDVVKTANFRALPKRLQRDLRSNHAGELGAVHFYRASLRFNRNSHVRNVAKRHLITERKHLRSMESLVPRSSRSRLKYVWIAAAWVLGICANTAGARGFYVTVSGIEQFVEHHYGAQLDALNGDTYCPELRQVLTSCLADETEHREQTTIAYAGSWSKGAKIWQLITSAGSHAAVYLARLI
ncbi:MAG: demethoxyubiquinone hydroxylase family protein [Pseudomonadota bacterium]